MDLLWSLVLESSRGLSVQTFWGWKWRSLRAFHKWFRISDLAHTESPYCLRVCEEGSTRNLLVTYSSGHSALRCIAERWRKKSWGPRKCQANYTRHPDIPIWPRKGVPTLFDNKTRTFSKIYSVSLSCYFLYSSDSLLTMMCSQKDVHWWTKLGDNRW